MSYFHSLNRDALLLPISTFLLLLLFLPPPHSSSLVLFFLFFWYVCVGVLVLLKCFSIILHIFNPFLAAFFISLSYLTHTYTHLFFFKFIFHAVYFFYFNIPFTVSTSLFGSFLSSSFSNLLPSNVFFFFSFIFL